MQKIKITPEYFQGCLSVEETKRYLKPWRIVESERVLFPSPDEMFLNYAAVASGVRLRLKTNSRLLSLSVVKVAGDRQFDLVMDGEVLQTVTLARGETKVIFEELKGRSSIYEIWFDPRFPIEVKGIEIEEGKSCSVAKDRRKRWVTYGSSITQCGEAASPANIWSGVAARDLDVNLTSLGFGGQCHLDPMMAKTIRDLPADLISLKLGINVMGNGSLNARSFAPALIGTIMTIREKHPMTPILLISPVCSPPRENQENVVGMTLSIMRKMAEDAVKRIKKFNGDPNLYYLSGLKLADEKVAKKYMPDLLHPNGEGYVLMAKNFVKHLPKEIKAIFKP